MVFAGVVEWIISGILFWIFCCEDCSLGECSSSWLLILVISSYSTSTSSSLESGSSTHVEYGVPGSVPAGSRLLLRILLVLVVSDVKYYLTIRVVTKESNPSIPQFI